MERAGLTEKSRFTIVEYPKPEFMNFNIFQPKLIGVDETQQALIDLLKFYARHNGQALTILPMELMLSAPLLFENR